jgi:acetyl esterase
MRAEVRGAPPAWIGLAEYDVLLSEGEAFAELLKDVGVPVKTQVYQGLTHGFARWFNLVDTADTALDDAVRAIRVACS